MTVRTSLAALALTLLGTTLPDAALADPVLRGDISVAGPVVTVGDMFADAGTLAAEGLFRAPAPGTTGTVTLAQIEAALARAGLDGFDAAGHASVRVTRAGIAVGETMLKDLIVADLMARGIMTANMTLDLSFDTRLPALVAPAVETPVSLELLRYHPGAGTLSARFSIAGSNDPLELTGQVQMLIEAPHLAASVASGALLTPGNIVMRPVPLAFAEAGGIAPVENLVGMQARRALREGVLIRPDDVTEPELIARNAQVTVIYRSGGLTLTTTGQALNAASLNQQVSVLNPMTRRVLQGTAAADGSVLISGAPQAVAGL